MINIGFDDEDIYQFDENGDPISQEGDKISEELKRKANVYLSEKRIQQFKDEYDCVVVHEFGDEYHLSEEERIEKNKFYEAFRVFSKYKHKYRKLDEYVVAMREALKCLDVVAESNGVYEPEKFKALFLKGKINITGLRLPQFKGRERKDINWDYLTDFILSDEDPSLVLPKKKDDILSKEDIDEMAKRLFDEGELERILRPVTEEEKLERMKRNCRVDDDDLDDRVVRFMSKKETKKILKHQPELLKVVKDMKRDNRRLDNMNRLVYQFTSDDMNEIEAYDKLHNYESSAKIPKFKGSLLSKSDYKRYMMQLSDYEDENVRVNYHGKLRTLEQVRELELKQVLERNNFNLRSFQENKEKESKLRKIQKKERKREKELRKKLMEVQERKKRRLGEDDVIVKSKKKKKKKGKKGKKSKEQPEQERINEYKKEAMENFDELILGTVGRMTGDFKDYKREVTDWSWDNIVKRG